MADLLDRYGNAEDKKEQEATSADKDGDLLDRYGGSGEQQSEDPGLLEQTVDTLGTAAVNTVPTAANLTNEYVANPVLRLAGQEPLPEVPLWEGPEGEQTWTGTAEETVKAVPRGGAGAVSSGLKGFSRLTGEAEGDDSPVREAGQAVEDWSRENFPADPAYRDSIPVKLGEGVGSMAAFLPTGAAGGVAARGLAGAAGATGRGLSAAQKTGQMGAAGTLAGGSGAEEAYTRAREAGQSEDDAQRVSRLYGVPSGVIQVANVTRLLRAMPKSARQKLMSGTRGRILGDMISEGTVEGAGAVGQNLGEQSYNEDQSLWEDVPERAALGAGSAGILQGGRALAARGAGALDEIGNRTASDKEIQDAADAVSRMDPEQAADVLTTPLLEAPEMTVSPDGEAATRAQREARDQERAELGLTPDVQRAQQAPRKSSDRRQDREAPAETDDPRGLPEPRTVADSQGRVGTEAQMEADRQRRTDMGMDEVAGARQSRADSTPEPRPEQRGRDVLRRKTDGKAYGSERAARKAIQGRGLEGYEPVQVSDGWALAPAETQSEAEGADFEAEYLGQQTTEADEGAPEQATESPEQASQRRARELRAAAEQAESPDVRRALKQDAEAEEARARGGSPKLTPEQRRRQRQRDNQTVRPEQDDLVTAIRKLGGLDTELETDWAQRLSHIDSERRPAPGQRNLERPGKPGARSLDDLAEPLQELGYLRNRDPRELEERLFSAERGAREYALPVEEDRMAQDMEEAERQRAEDEAEREAQADEADEIMSAFQDYAREVEAETPALDDAGEPAPFSEALLSLAREAENNDPGRVESIMEDAARQGRTETEVTSELLDIIRGEADADRAADPGRDPGAQEDGGETPSGSRAEAPIEAASAAGPAEGAAEEVGSLELEAQTEQVLADQQERIEAAEQAEADRRRQEEQRAQADAEVDEFTLTGSDLPADQAAARGQQDLMADTAPESAPAEFTPTHETSDGTPVRETEETGVFVDRDGVEVEDDAATPIGEDGAEGSALETAEREAQTSPDNDLPEPTEAQKAAGNYKVGKARLHGLDISIENPAGSTRSGTAPDGTEWSNTMTHPYGYIRGTEGKDGDQVDAYFGPDTESDNPTAYVVDQVDPESRRFDEHKVMFGFPSEEAAVKGYLDNYEKGWTGIGGVREMPLDEFKSWLQEGDTTKPVARRIPKSKAKELASQYQADAEAEGDTEAEGAAEATDNQAEEAADNLIRKPDGSPYPSAQAARAGRNRADLKDRKDHLEPVEVEGGWALRDTAEDQAGSAEGQAEVDRLTRRATERLAEENPTMIRAAKGSVREDAPQGTLEDARRQIGRLWEKRLGAILAEDDAVDADAANEIMNRDQPMPDSELRWLAEQEAPAQEGSQNKGARGPRGQAEQALEEARTAAEQIPEEVGVKAEQIPFDLAERAHSGTSQTPDVRALQEQATYLREMVDAYEAMAPLATTDQKRADLVEALKDYSTEYARRQRDLLNARSGMMSSMVTGPAKFPQRSQQKKQGAYDKKAEDFDAWKKKARKDIRRKLRPEDAPVRATDADAVERLEAQITEREQVQERMKQANKIIRDQKRTEDEKRRALVDEVGLSESQSDGALSPDFAGRKGFAQPTLNNNNAQIKRLRQRLSEIQDQKQAAEDTGGEVEAEFDGGRVTADFGERRLRVEHDQKPAQETRDALKAAGFRWSRANGAWQATLNNRAITRAEQITGADLGVDQSGNPRDEGPRYSFAGKRAKTSDPHSLASARRLLGEGVDPEAVRQRTGWFKGPDDQWRFEISDDQASIKKPWPHKEQSFGDAWEQMFKRYLDEGRTGVRVSDILDHPRLFAAYPEVTEISVGRQSRPGATFKQFKGWEPAEIDIYEEMPMSKVKSALLHEIQHAIQNKEGFARGGSPDTFQAEHGRLQAEVSRINEAIREASRDEDTGRYNDLLEERKKAVDRILELEGEDGIVGADQYERLAGEVEARNTQARQRMTDEERRATAPEETADRAAEDVIVQWDGEVMENAPIPDNAPAGVSRADLSAMVERVTGNWKGAPPINPVDNEFQLPGDLLLDIVHNGALGEVRGVYHQGQIHLVGENIPDMATAERILLHESIGHFGLRRALGDEHAIKQTLNRVWTSFGKSGHQDIIDTYFPDGDFDVNNADHRMIVAEEKLAHLAETGQKPTLVQRAVATIRNALRKMGFNLDLNESDLADLIRRSHRVVERGGIDGPMEAEQDTDIRMSRVGNLLARIRGGVPEASDSTLKPAASGKPGSPLMRLASKNLEPIKGVARKYFTSAGDLPIETFKQKVRNDGWIRGHEKRGEELVRDLRKAASKAYHGNPSTKKLHELDAALKSQVPLSDLPEGVRKPIKQMREHIDDISQKMVRDGIVEGDLAAKVTDNLGVYATRSYRVFDDPKWAQKVPAEVRNKAKNFLRGQYEGILAKEWAERKGTNVETAKQDMATPDTEANRYREDRLEGIINNLLFEGKAADSSPMALLSSGSQLGAKDLSILKKRKDIAPEIRALWGEYGDPMANYAKSIDKMVHLIANHRLLQDMRDQGMEQWFFTEPRGEFHAKVASSESDVLWPMTQVGGETRDIYTTPEIKEAMEDAVSGNPTGWAFAQYMKANAAVKYTKTVGSVQTHVRNTIGNTPFAMAQGHWRVGKAGRSWKAVMTDLANLNDTEMREYIEKMLNLGVIHESVRAGELRDVLQDASQMSMDEFQGNRASRAMKRGLNKLTNVYQAEDDVWKYYAFENEKARLTNALSGSDGYQSTDGWVPNTPEAIEQHAADLVRMTYPTYSLVPEAVKKMRRFPLTGTFVSFPAEVIRVTGNTVKLIHHELRSENTQIRKVGAQRMVGSLMAASIPTMASMYSMYALGLSDEDDEDFREMVPPWSRNSDIIYTGYDDEDRLQWIDVSYTDPYEYVKTPIRALMRGEDWQQSVIQSGWQAMEPFLGEEILAGKLVDLARNETETGQKVWNPQASYEDIALDATGHLWDAFEPGTLSSMERIYKGFTGFTEDYGKSYDGGRETAAMLTGFRMNTMDIPQALSFKAGDYARGKRDVARMLTSTLSSRGEVSEDDIRRAFHETVNSHRELFKDMHKVSRAAISLGHDRDQVMRILNSGGVAEDDAQLIVEGTFKPYRPTGSFADSVVAGELSDGMSRVEQHRVKKKYQERFDFLMDLYREHGGEEEIE